MAAGGLSVVVLAPKLFRLLRLQGLPNVSPATASLNQLWCCGLPLQSLPHNQPLQPSSLLLISTNYHTDRSPPPKVRLFFHRQLPKSVLCKVVL